MRTCNGHFDNKITKLKVGDSMTFARLPLNGDLKCQEKNCPNHAFFEIKEKA